MTKSFDRAPSTTQDDVLLVDSLSRATGRAPLSRTAPILVNDMTPEQWRAKRRLVARGVESRTPEQIADEAGQQPERAGLRVGSARAAEVVARWRKERGL